jgi:hypothetical protein
MFLFETKRLPNKISQIYPKRNSEDSVGILFLI